MNDEILPSSPVLPTTDPMVSLSSKAVPAVPSVPKPKKSGSLSGRVTHMMIGQQKVNMTASAPSEPSTNTKMKTEGTVLTDLAGTGLHTIGPLSQSPPGPLPPHPGCPPP